MDTFNMHDMTHLNNHNINNPVILKIFLSKVVSFFKVDPRNVFIKRVKSGSTKASDL